MINLRNLVSLPRNPSTLLYDGRDRFGGTKALVVTRTGWAVAPGSVLAGSVEVMATMDYGTQYISPVGQDVSASSMFEYVWLMVMSRENGTSVTVDINGPVSGGATTFTLNQGESYLVNGGVLKGATVSATKPVQVQLITGDIGARYETDWFTLYPVADWTGTYYSPVGTAADGDAAFGFFYNPNASAITINVVTSLGTSSFNVSAYGVTQYQMPQNSGAKFTSANDETFFGLVMVGANPTANNVHDWGFTLVPSDSLTTEAVVGWGPGSSDLSQNGSPVWVTPVAASRVYVDYNGDRNGSLTDPRGNKYDAHYDLTALETRRLFDPDKDQSAMRVYTLDGSQIAAAWGQDPATAGPGNPFLDVGTTVLPFPVPTLKKTYSLTTDTAPTGLSIGDTIEYRIEVDNKGLLPLGNLLVLDPLNVSLTYVAGSTARDGTAIPDGSTGTLFPLDEDGYVVPIILRGGSTFFTYRCTINAAGSIANTASNSNYNLVSTANVVVAPPAGSTPCGAQFTNSTGTVQAAYSAGALVYGTLTDPDANNNVSVAESITIVVNNTSKGDAEFVTLLETAVNSGIFRNTTGLPTSTTTGTSQMDGTLLVSPGNSLSFTYTDPEFSETCTGSAIISVPTQNKFLYLSDPAQALDRIDPVAAADATTASTSALSYSPPGVTVGSTTSSSAVNAASLTFSHTSGSGSNRMLVVTVSVGSGSVGGSAGTISSVTYNGVTMTEVGTAALSGARVSIYRLLNPAAGPANVVVSTSTGSTIEAGATTFENVDQATPLGTFASASANSGTATVNVTSATNEIVICVGSVDEAFSNQGMTTTSGQTQLWNSSGTDFVSGAASTKPGAASVTVSYTATDSTQEWAIGGVSIKPASGGGATTAAFTQVPTFASSFSLPTGSTPAVSAYYTVTSGSMPASPSITATLKKGLTTLAVSTSTAASATTGSGLFTFGFAALGSSINFASSEALTLEINDSQSGVTFTVDFDSSTKPSKITLPTTTVINVDSLGVYDAPYPGGSLITAPASGTTAYVRSTASDPFGAYDITSMGLSIDGPGATGDVSTTLNAGQVVATGTGTKTYEYAWTVGSTTGTYNIAVTANEGTEGIQATRATSVNVTFLDLGTPSITEFTTGSNGPHTTTYAGNEQVLVRIVDLDQNLDAGVAEAITAVITSLAGDSELVTLTETGINTGIFVVGIPASTTAPNTFNNGTLHAVLGDVLTVNYVDPTDSTDTGTDTATIPNIAPAISVNKTLVTPADGQAVVGEAIQYTVQVTNTGNTTLSTVALTDLYPAADLTFISASVTPTTSGGGSVTWSNVGPLTQGQSTTITLNFTALSTAAPTTNTATADAGGGVTGGDTADVTITDPAITISKTLLSPNPGPASIGDNVTFRITLQNTGDTAIATLPLEDTFSGADFEFVSATVTPDATGAGSLLWLDVTGAGTLGVSASTTIDVTLQAKGAAAPAVNLAAANYTVDVNGDGVPPVSSSASITLTAAMISGHVYDDVDQSVTFNGGDAVLTSITVSLYTDPNGDGNPADGTLVAITSTDAAGAYEFLNLPAGSYVIVESQPPGYSSSGDTAGANDNRIPVVVSALTTYAGNNFFDYLTPPVSYSSIAGKVWNDADASATVNGGEVGIENVPVDLVEDTNGNGIADPGEPVVSSTLTAADGSYSFTGLNAGNYVVVENDLFGWYSTADVTAPNDNMVPVALAAATNVTGRDFLDVLTGTTGGKVFHDVNGNGSFDGGDVALANIDVIITDSLGVAQTVITDIDGNWTATVPPGSTSVNVDQTDPQFTAFFSTGYTQTAGTDPNTITAVSNVNTPAGDDGFRQVGTVTGHLYIDTNGNGSQDSGEPDLANIDVIITDSNSATQTVITDVTGNWTATVPPGNTSVNVDNSDPQFPAGVTQIEGTDPTSVTAVANTPSSAGNDGYFVPGTISGSVMADTDNDDDGDDLIPGVTLTLKDSNGDDIDSNTSLPGIQPTTTTTNGSGAYSFGNLPPGSYRVVETDPVGYLSVSPNTINPVVVTAGATTSGVNFIDEQPATIGNLVWHDANNDGINNNGELGIDGVLVELLDPLNVVIGSTTTAGGGLYTFANVAPGSYRLRIATPPTLYPLSSTTTDTADNSEDDDDNGTQATPTAATLSPLVAVSAAQVKNSIDFGFAALAGTRSISGEVRDDYDLDSNFSDNDQPVPSVTVRLYADSNGNGLFDSGTDTLIGTTTTNILGQYSFTGLPDGTYFIQEVDPAGATSTGDTQGSNDNLIPVTLAGSNSIGNDFLDAVDPSGYIYSPVDGRIIAGGSISVNGPGAVTILMDGSTGQYSFITDGTAGIYTMSYTPPVGYQIDPTRPVAGVNFDPTGLPSPHVLGSAEDPLNTGHLANYSAGGNPYYLTFDLTAGDPLVINNNIPLVEIKPTNFTGWQYANQLSGQNGATQDPDGDGVTNLEEFAFCFNPSSGINGSCSLRITRNGDGTIDALMRRVVGATGITYQLEYIADLTSSGASGAGWTDVTTISPTVTSNGDGTETARYLNLATIPALSGGQGFVRIKVTLISSGTIVRGETSGWATRSIATACQSCSQPFLKCEVFTGSVDGVVGSALSVINSVGTGNLAAQFTSGRHYYVEVIAGDHEGHRFEINEAASTPNSIAIDTASTRNTLGTSLPATLAGDQVVVREHYRINELFVPDDFTGTLSPATADRLLFHDRNSGTFSTFWLFTHPLSGLSLWVEVADASLTDAGNRVLDVCEGMFVHPKGSAMSLVFTGQVRSNDLTWPLVAGAIFTGNGWPLDMSPTTRKMLITDGFTGNRSPTAADRIQLWTADENPTAEGYTSYFLLNAASMQRWVQQADASVSSQDSAALFKMLRGQFVQPRTARPNLIIANPWIP